MNVPAWSFADLPDHLARWVMANRIGTSIVTAIVLASALPAPAQTPLGSEFRVDTFGVPRLPFTVGGTTARASAVSPDGSFVLTWLATDVGGDATDVVARRFDAAGVAQGAEFLVNTYTTGYQYNQAVAIDDANNFVVVWTSDRQDGSYDGVFGQRFDASGTRLGAEFRVNSTTSFRQLGASIAVAPGGDYVVVWASPDADSYGIFGQRYDASGLPAGAEFQVNTYTTAQQYIPSVDADGAGNFVVVWTSVDTSPAGRVGTYGQRFSAAGTPQGGEFAVNSDPSDFQVRARMARSRDGSFVVVWDTVSGVYARRFDTGGLPLGADFRVHEYTTSDGFRPDVDADADGDFVVTWQDQDAGSYDVFARRFESTGVGGGQFKVNTSTTGHQTYASIASDPAGNFVVAWHSSQSGVNRIFAQRYAGGLLSAGLAVDLSAGPTSDGNRVFEPGETVTVAPAWLNANFTAETFSGTASSFSGPGAPGDPTYTIADGAASYGTVASNATGSCTASSNCYTLGVTVPSARPALHWDASFHEQIAPANLGAAKTWALHIGDSFVDVPRVSGFYRFVETVLHRGITAGCSPTQYCPAASTTREQMAVFVLVAKEGAGYVPLACTTPVFSDVPATSPFCRWIEELFRRGVVGGCGGSLYCPSSAVTRDQMAVFVLRTLDPTLVPPFCTTPIFADVPASSPFCRWIEELARRGVVTGCGGGNYCPTAPVTREQMAVFLSVTFGLMLYGP
jgi:S-layer homology domain